MTAFFKKPLVRWLLLLLVIFSVYHGVMSNLKRHSLYYLSQSNYDKTKLLEYVLLAENYEYFNFEGLEGKTYREHDFFQGIDQIIYEGDDGTSWRLATQYNNYIMGRFFRYYRLEDSARYVIGENGELLAETETSKFDVQTMRQLITPIMVTQKAPVVNLQWLFNVFNDLRFD